MSKPKTFDEFLMFMFIMIMFIFVQILDWQYQKLEKRVAALEVKKGV